MKFSGDSEIFGLTIDSLMNWNNGDHMLIHQGANSTHSKVMLGGGDDDEDSNNSKNGGGSGDIDDLDLLLTSTQSPSSQEPNNNNLAELKPLPPFTGYTGHLSINGISGHHYHTIASAPSPPRVEANNNSSDTTNQNTLYYTTDQVVSSSTMDCTLENIKTEVSVEDYNTLLPPDIEDIAAIIGSAIADTTVPGSNANNNNSNNSNGNNNVQNNTSNGETSRDSWMDIDAWIDNACSQSSSTNGKTIISAESLQEFVASAQFSVASPAAAVIAYQQQHIKREPTSSYMPLLQGRLQNGPTKDMSYGGSGATLVSECPSPSSSTPYLAHSPPGHVVSTSDLVRYNPVHSSRPSPELQVGYPHTTTPGKKSKSKSKSKSAAATSTIVYSETGLGKEKPVHRCTICNRGFLNKSNIKVHLRTHTGEKPFRCDVCGKAFRQKAHLIKHAQIHKRIGRD